jgi:hypothetical protein
MKKLLIVLTIIAASCASEEIKPSNPVKLKTEMEPPPGCGTDSNGVKYCCNSFGTCWRENW